MDNGADRAEEEDRLLLWGDWLRRRGLDSLALALLEAAEPFALLGAQALYVAEPALRVFFPGEAVGRWARSLEDPTSIARLRARLAPTDEDDR